MAQYIRTGNHSVSIQTGRNIVVSDGDADVYVSGGSITIRNGSGRIQVGNGNVQINDFSSTPVDAQEATRQAAEELRLAALKAEARARAKRDQAMREAMQDRRDFEAWKAAREAYINGDDTAFDAMMNSVRLEDSDGYDSTARDA